MKLAAIALLAQVASQPYIETFEVRLHNVDVVVTDASGKAVRGLTKEDFIILEDGVQQPVTNFSVIDETAGELEYRGTSGTPVSRAAGDAEVPRNRGTEVPVPRKFVFFIDELALHPRSREKLFLSAMNLANGAMREGDTAAIVRPIGESNVVQEFTSDLPTLERGLRKVMDESHTRANTQAQNELRFLDQQLGYAQGGVLARKELHNVRRMYTDMVRRRVEQRLGQLRSLVASMSGSDGKKVLVLVTSSLSAQPGREAYDPEQLLTEQNTDDGRGLVPEYRDFRPQIDELARTAAVNGVTIYALQPDVQLELAAGMGAATRTGNTNLPARIFSDTLTNNELTMHALAEKTGGKWFRGDGKIDDLFEQVSEDLRAYYSLGYRARGDRDKPKKLEVRIRNRPELRVRTRTDVLEKSSSREMEDLVVASLLYPREVNELGVRTTAGKLMKDRNLFTVPLDTHIPMDKLTFLPSGEGKYRASFAVTFAAAGERLDFSAGQERTQGVEITEEQYKALAGKTFHYTTRMVVAPGRVKIAVGVLDLTSKLSGFHTIEVNAK
jgi:VWFA-related protein